MYDDLTGLAADLVLNARKIDEHGRRADSIVSGMLLHSRGHAGERQDADINALLEEYVNLAYHGMRAQDSSFNVTIERDYDPAVGNMLAVPQDLSRVFLNIVNNACYATHEQKQQPSARRAGFPPTLTVTTRNLGDGVEVRSATTATASRRTSATASSTRSSRPSRPAKARASACRSATTSSCSSTTGSSRSNSERAISRSSSYACRAAGCAAPHHKTVTT